MKISRCLPLLTGCNHTIMETSRQAKTLIPMTISIGFGSIFATMITLILIPSLYVAIDDINKHILKKKNNTVKD